MIYTQVPKEFNSKFEAVGCFVQHEGKIVILHRQNHKPQGNTWGIPSGKIDEGETPLDTVFREVTEETGLIIPKNQMNFFSTVYVKFPDHDFTYHLFYTTLNKKIDIKINENEHKDSKWISPKDSLNLPLIEDLDQCMELFFNR